MFFSTPSSVSCDSHYCHFAAKGTETQRLTHLPSSTHGENYSQGFEASMWPQALYIVYILSWMEQKFRIPCFQTSSHTNLPSRHPSQRSYAFPGLHLSSSARVVNKLLPASKCTWTPVLINQVLLGHRLAPSLAVVDGRHLLQWWKWLVVMDHMALGA